MQLATRQVMFFSRSDPTWEQIDHPGCVGLMLDQRQRRWSNIKPTQGRGLFVGSVQYWHLVNSNTSRVFTFLSAISAVSGPQKTDYLHRPRHPLHGYETNMNITENCKFLWRSFHRLHRLYGTTDINYRARLCFNPSYFFAICFFSCT